MGSLRAVCRQARAPAEDNVETLHCMENPHVYGVFCFRAMRSFHDLWLRRRTGRTSGRLGGTRMLRGSERPSRRGPAAKIAPRLRAGREQKTCNRWLQVFT